MNASRLYIGSSLRWVTLSGTDHPVIGILLHNGYLYSKVHGDESLTEGTDIHKHDPKTLEILDTWTGNVADYCWSGSDLISDGTHFYFINKMWEFDFPGLVKFDPITMLPVAQWVDSERWGTMVTGICYYDGYVYIGCDVTHKILKIRTSDMTLQGTYDAGVNFSTAGVATDGTYLYAVNQESSVIGSKALKIDPITMTLAATPNTAELTDWSFSGLNYHDGYLYGVTGGSGYRVIKIDPQTMTEVCRFDPSTEEGLPDRVTWAEYTYFLLFVGGKIFVGLDYFPAAIMVLTENDLSFVGYWQAPDKVEYQEGNYYDDYFYSVLCGCTDGSRIYFGTEQTFPPGRNIPAKVCSVAISEILEQMT